MVWYLEWRGESCKEVDMSVVWIVHDGVDHYKTLA
jgi:hypothetical protein